MSELGNARHEAFAQGVAAGKSKTDAYKAVYPRAEAWKDQTVYNKASDLAKRPEVQERVEELQQSATSETVLTIAGRKELLSRIALDECESTQVRIKAIDTLNKMDGAYVENVNVNGSINNPFSGLTTAELRELVRDG